MAKQKKIQGLTVDRELNEEHLVRDTRHVLKKFVDWISIPNNMVALLFVMGGVCFAVPEISEFMFILACLFFWWAMRREESAPIKMPIQAEYLDPHEPHPGHGRPTPGQGIFFLGNELKTGKEVWLTNSDARQHFLVVGTTGAGNAQPLDALVHTPTGFCRMGDLRVGMRVSTRDGRGGDIKAIYPQGEVDIYRVTFADGRSTEACGEHLWGVFDQTGGYTVRDTLEIASALEHGQLYVPKRYLGIGSADRERAEAIIVSACRELPSRVVDAQYPLVIETNDAGAAELIAAAREIGGEGIVEVGAGTVHLYCEILQQVFGDHRESDYRAALEKLGSDNPIRRDALAISMIEHVGRKEAQCIYIDHPDRLYITDDYVVTHNTESLLGFAANALMWGSGFLFCDGKGDVALFAKVYALARRFGREDDLLVLNFMTGNQDLGAAGGKVMSNTLNPFSTGSSDSLTQMVVALMDDAGGDGAMWKGRATAMLTGVMRALTWLRDEGHVDLNVGEIRDFMSLRRIVDLADTDKYPEMPQPIRKTINSYLTSLPGFQPEKGYKQAQTTLDQHGYLEMQFTKILGSLADVYGHIFFTPSGEVDMFDVVLNRRILVIMLPALEKSGDEIANLGKIVVATLKGMMGATLGATLEGGWAEVVDNRPTNSPSPFICVLDEVGYYTVEGMALMAAQARSLGFTMVYASQDIPAMKRLNEKEAASIIANTNTKIFMRSEEADVTGKLAVDTAGRGIRAQTGGYSGKTGELGTTYSDAMDARFETVERVNFTDLKAQTEGMMHVLFQDKIVRAKSFYANPEGAVDKKRLKLRANHFIKVPKPDLEELERARKMPEITAKLLSEEHIEVCKKDAEAACAEISKAENDITLVMQAFERMKSGGRKPVEAAAAAVAAVIHDQREAVTAFQDRVRRASGIGELDLSDEDLDGGPEGDPDDNVPAFGEPYDPGKARKSRPILNTSIRHRTMIEDDDFEDAQVINMDDDVVSNDGIMAALAAIDFEEGTSKDEVEGRLSDALNPADFMTDDDIEDDRPEPSEVLISDAEDAITDSSAGSFDDLDGLGLEEPERGEGGSDSGEGGKSSSTGGSERKAKKEEMPGDPNNITTHLLSQLLLDDDDDD